MARFLLLPLFLIFSATLLAQQPRYALVIGNGDYEYASLGQTPANDANAMRDALTLAGFQVDYYTNLDQSKLSNAISAFGRKIKDSGGVAMFYYSGHGVQYNNQNYLVPIGAEMTDEDDIEGLCVPISRITSRMLSAGTVTNIVVLDACRAFPLKREGKSLTKGLAKEDYAVPELLVAFATAPGSTATVRGENGLSLYTSQLLKYIKTPGLVLETVLKNTRKDVIAKSNGQQRPDEIGNLTSDFYFFKSEQPPITVWGKSPQDNPLPHNTSPNEALDTDLDGTPDATDPCPNDYGTLAAGGCPDYDEDGVPNQSDKCPTQAGKKSWQGCPDSDEDGVPDHEDKCPFEPGTLADKGCLSPNADRDGDGVLNSKDKCPSIKGSPENGCPDPPFVKEYIVLQGETLQSIAKKYDLIVSEIAQINSLNNDEYLPPRKRLFIPIAAIGIDRDADGIPDREDNCPTLKGTAIYKGCPNLSPYGYRSDDFVRVTGGVFQMGRKDSNSEMPIHSVSVPTFELGKYEVTNAQLCIFLNDIKDTISSISEGGKVTYKDNVIFYLFCDSTKSRCSGFTDNIKYSKNAGSLQVDALFSPVDGYENHPAVLVSWYGAKAYCNWLSQKTGQNYHLPSEAEWEFAARGGNSSKGYKYAGSNSLEDVAWYTVNSNNKSHPVGQKAFNEIGLYDMNGNVWEWCADTWHDSYLGAPNDGSAWVSNRNLYLIVSRGGAWFNRDKDLLKRCPESSPERGAMSLGFRIARVVEGK